MTDEEKTLNDGISAENGEMKENGNVKEGEGADGLSEPVRGNFLSSDGRTAISFYTVEPEGVPRAIVQVSHGMSEYAGRYLEFGRYLAAHGIMFAANDHLGHGETALTADDLGYFAEKDGYLLRCLSPLKKDTRSAIAIPSPVGESGPPVPQITAPASSSA